MTERELSRKANWRLAIIRHAQEVTGNVAFTCRYYGVNRQSYYKWLRRYEELGVDRIGAGQCAHFARVSYVCMCHLWSHRDRVGHEPAPTVLTY